MSIESFSRWSHYILEILTVYVVLSVYYLFLDTLPPIASLLVFFLLGPIPFVLLILIRKEKTAYYQIVLLIPIPVLLGYMLDFSLLIAILLSAFVAWRITSLYLDATQQNEGGLLLLTLILSVVAYLVFTWMGKPDTGWILMASFLQFSLFVASNLVKGFLSRAKQDRPQNWRVQSGIGILSFLVAIFGIAGIISAFYPVIKNIIFYMVHLVTMAIAFPFSPLFNYVAELEANERTIDPEAGKMKGEMSEGEPAINQLNDTLSNSWIYLVILGFLIILFILWRNRNRLKRFAKGWRNDPILSVSSTAESHSQSMKQRFRIKVPKEEIRKQFFHLERYADKKGYGRKSGETVGEWFERLDLPAEDSVSIIELYRQVRYGGAEVERKEKDAYRRAISRLKEAIKQKKNANEEDS